MPSESAHDTIAVLGDVGLLQFKDLNSDKSAFQRAFANQVKRCDEMARKIRFFHDQVRPLRGGSRPQAAAAGSSSSGSTRAARAAVRVAAPLGRPCWKGSFQSARRRSHAGAHTS